MSAVILTLPPKGRRPRPAAEPTGPLYESVMLRDLTVSELVAALRFSGIHLSTVHGRNVLHRSTNVPRRET